MVIYNYLWFYSYYYFHPKHHRKSPKLSYLNWVSIKAYLNIYNSTSYDILKNILVGQMIYLFVHEDKVKYLYTKQCVVHTPDKDIF